MAKKPTSIHARRDEAVEKVAHEVFAITLGMEHVDSIREVTMAELRRALEKAYELGRRSALS